MGDHDGLEVQHHPNHRKRPWWVVRIFDDEEGFGEVLSTHVNESGASRKLKRIRNANVDMTGSDGESEIESADVDKSGNGYDHCE